MTELNENKKQEELVQRINILANKQKATGLDEAEEKEQAALRKEYLANFRSGLRDRIEHTKLYDKKGNEVTSSKVRKIQHDKGWRED
ncbi:DUF896 domain-containing protein [Bombilactobacillus folatiphilus]|uniref:UPF0291 protein MOO45_05095 n=1 Tax=Bombilactobacillus folatiphilus TaxID=2923362 RepID=A0ABY4P7G8_9LACO|nr:DUF896 domain-containing protein [Bombilactobacillus folatiphilus]UQS81597.1 DUF896 domain-containing protein [Bombilactobacillus folatiphilus]